jgi:hypothetical protein
MNSYLRLKFCYIPSFKPPFIVSFYVNFSLSLSLFSLLLRLRTPLHTGASRGLYSTCSNYLIQYPTSFSSIDGTFSLSCISLQTQSFLCPLSILQKGHTASTIKTHPKKSRYRKLTQDPSTGTIAPEALHPKDLP